MEPVYDGMDEPARRKLEIALACLQTPRPATLYAVFGYRRQADLLLTCRRTPSWPVVRLRWLAYADEDVELHQDLFVRLCSSHDRRMRDSYIGCAPGWRGEGGRCGDIVAEDVLAVLERTTRELLR